MKFIPYIKFGLLIICVIAFVAGMATYDSASPRTVTGGLDFLFLWSFILMVVTIAAALLMPLIGVVQNPKSALRSLVGLGLVVLVFVVAYAISSAEPIPLPSGKMLDNAGELKFADTALYATYFAFAGVILSIVGSEIYKIFK